LFVNSSGQVGIGTITPASGKVLDVNGNANVNGALSMANMSASGTATISGMVGLGTSTPAFTLQVVNNGSANGYGNAVIAGWVGIGTTTFIPGDRVTVSGGALHATSNLTVDGCVTMGGCVTIGKVQFPTYPLEVVGRSRVYGNSDGSEGGGFWFAQNSRGEQSSFIGRGNNTDENLVGIWNSGDWKIFANDNGSITLSGNTTVSGNFSVVGGTKNFVQPHPTDSTKKIVYVCAEAGEALTMVRGNAKTINGVSVIDLPDHFALVTSNKTELTTQVTVKKVPAVLFVDTASKERIVVKMKYEDYRNYGDVGFSYFVQGVRAGFEDHAAIQDVDNEDSGTNDPVIGAKYQKLVERLTKGKAGRK
jgi:hypothetical protein